MSHHSSHPCLLPLVWIKGLTSHDHVNFISSRLVNGPCTATRAISVAEEDDLDQGYDASSTSGCSYHLRYTRSEHGSVGHVHCHCQLPGINILHLMG